ncbi:Abi family protein [Pseudolactococcus reticulitermitis]|uniref:Abi family protein n=1 Tax=Pseudolactococcus reticulitermitis TaxID=2025039 RepID=A0A224X2G4_9LACT|nr:Abi family protein [Lactococcus reticulitermitis]GAX47036.1 hypothetical protein RsY01_617 [Lactococcus reticulitermitis]
MTDGKGKLSFSELIASLDVRGVTFEEMAKSQAIYVLQNKNYYYKISAFRKNFYKKDGRYFQLDFANLVDLASIDMQIRYFLMEISLDIEHSIKTQLMRLITENEKEDGYTLVQEFSASYPFSYNKFYGQFERSRYQNDMFDKRHAHIPVWTLIELMDFGSLVDFVQFYYQKYDNRRLKKMNNLCISAKYIRNACAHNNVLMINFFGRKNQLKKYPSAAVQDYARSIGVERKFVTSKKVNDLISLFALEKEYASAELLGYRRERGNELLQRCLRYSDRYQENQNLVDLYHIFSALVHYL